MARTTRHGRRLNNRDREHDGINRRGGRKYEQLQNPRRASSYTDRENRPRLRSMTAVTRFPVGIIGGGPSGLILAIELGRRGVPCVLFETNADTPQFPKANATTSRTMEHYRRLGFAAEVRASGMPEDYPQDITYFTRFTGYELARLPGLSRGAAARSREGSNSRWPTPEPLHRTQQMFIEAVMKREAEKAPSADIRFGWRVNGVEPLADGVAVDAVELASGRAGRIECDYVVGCDGGRSLVREALGIRYEGFAGEERDFMGGRMLAVYIRAPELYRLIPAAHSWQYWAVNRQRRAFMCAIDGHGLFVFHTQLPRGQTGTMEYAVESLALATGCEFAHEIIGIAEWTAGFTLVAERFGSDRMFLAGDAAHLFTPTGGQGYNTSVDDAANLGWKLAALLQGWGGKHLLESYEQERKPVAERNTRFARAMADSIGRIQIPENIEDSSSGGAAARTEFGERLLDHCKREFDSPGIHFGISYADSPIIAGDGTRPPDKDWHHYTPNAVPGARAPHIWIADGVSIFDRFGRDFTLLRLGGGCGIDVTTLTGAAARRGMPLAQLDVVDEAARNLYAADLVLIRPDHHVAWRGNAVPGDADALVARISGHAA